MTTAQIAREFGLTTKKLNKILPYIGKSGRSVLHREGIQYRAKSGAWLLYFKIDTPKLFPILTQIVRVMYGLKYTLNGLKRVVSSSTTHLKQEVFYQRRIQNE